MFQTRFISFLVKDLIEGNDDDTGSVDCIGLNSNGRSQIMNALDAYGVLLKDGLIWEEPKAFFYRWSRISVDLQMFLIADNSDLHLGTVKVNIDQGRTYLFAVKVTCTIQIAQYSVRDQIVVAGT